MYIPLSFMGGSNIAASCNCNFLDFELTIGSGQYIDLTYQPCNGEQIQTIRYTTNTVSLQNICVGDRNFNFTGTGIVGTSNLDRPCVQASCQSCNCYEFYYQTSIDPVDHYISYIPCNVPSSSRQILGPLAPLSTGSFICSFPWMVTSISGALDYGTNGPSGVIKQVNSGSCQPITSGSIQVGDLRGGGRVLYVTGSYPNQSGLIVATASVATSSANFNRWGYFGTVTNINNQAYGTGASNTAALRNRVPTTGSIAANAMTQSINGYNDWFLPSLQEVNASRRNNISWPVSWNTFPLLDAQPLLALLTKNNNILTSNEKPDGTLAQRATNAKVGSFTPYAFDPDISKNATGFPFYAYRYFTSSLVP